MVDFATGCTGIRPMQGAYHAPSWLRYGSLVRGTHPTKPGIQLNSGADLKHIRIVTISAIKHGVWMTGEFTDCSHIIMAVATEPESILVCNAAVQIKYERVMAGITSIVC